MTRCFLCYADADRRFAEMVRLTLETYGVPVFLASSSLRPGDRWSDVVWQELRASTHVIFLASEQACRSAYVQQELGAALCGCKRVIPVIWNLDPGRLPGWISSYQVLDLRRLAPRQVTGELRELAEQVRAGRRPTLSRILVSIGLTVLFLGLEREGREGREGDGRGRTRIGEMFLGADRR